MRLALMTAVAGSLLLSASQLWGQIDIRNYGAVCNGVNDDSAAVQAAFNAVPDGGTVVIPCVAGVGAAGVTLQSKSNVTVAGQNGGGFRALAPTRIGAQGFGPITFVVRFCTQCTIRDLVLEGNSVATGAIGFDRCTETTADRNTIRNVGYSNAALAASGNTRNRYTRNTVVTTLSNAARTDGARGFWIGNVASNEVEWYPYIGENTIQNIAATSLAIIAVGAQLIGNTVEDDLGAGIKLQPPPGVPGQTIVEGNTIRRCFYGGIQVENVSDTVIRNNLIEFNGGWGIFLWHGFRNSQITGNTIRNNVTSRANGWQGGILVGYATDSLIANNNLSDTRVGAARTQDNGILVLSAGIRNLTIRDNICTNHYISGIYVNNHFSMGGPVENLLISGNQCTNNSEFGLEIWETMPGGMNNVTLSNNTFTGNGYGPWRANTAVNVVATPPPTPTDVTAPVRSSGAPAGTLATGATSATLSLSTDESASCRYSTQAGTTFGSMANTFGTTGALSHSTTVSNLQPNTTYNYYVRCQDATGNANTDDFPISFNVPAAPTPTPGGGPPSAQVLWLRGDAGVVLNSNGVAQWLDQSGNGNHASQSLPAAQPLIAPAAANGYPALHFDSFNDALKVSNSGNLDMGTGSFTISFWMRSPFTNSIGGHLRKGDGPFSLDGGGWELRNQFSLLEFARGRRTGVAQRSQAFVQSNVWMAVTVTYSINTGLVTMYVNGQQVASAVSSGAFGDGYDLDIGRGRDGYFLGDIAEILIYNRALQPVEFQQLQAYYQARYSGAPPPPPSDTTAPSRSGATPTGTLAAGTSSVSISLQTNEAATCKYSTTSGTTYVNMPQVFTTTGGNVHSAPVTNLQNGTSYSFFVRCNDAAGNANTDDYAITFSLAATAGSGTSTAPSGPSLWLKADAGVTLNAGNVMQWSDQSGNNNHAVQTTAANQPALVSNGVNGKPSLRFDSTSDYLRVANSQTLNFGSGSYSVSYWYKSAMEDSITGHFRKGDSPFNLNGRGWEFRTQYRLFEFSRGTGSGSSPRLQYMAPAGGRWYHITVVYNAASMLATMYVNGVALASTAYSNAYQDVFDLEIGRGRDGYLNGELAEVLVYPRALTFEEVTQLQRYLAGRYVP